MDSRPSGGSDDPDAVPNAYPGTSRRDQAGSVAGPGEPIGGLPGRRPGRFDALFYPFQPQQAWLRGTVLTVEFNGESATCDLVTATRIRIRGRPVPVFNRGWMFDVLFACEDDTTTPARLVLAGPGWNLLTGPQFRRLAQIIGTRSDAGDRPRRGIVRRLNTMTEDQDARSQTLDWSIRTNPQGLQKNEGRGSSDGCPDTNRQRPPHLPPGVRRRPVTDLWPGAHSSAVRAAALPGRRQWARVPWRESAPFGEHYEACL